MQKLLSSLPELVALVLGVALLFLRARQARTQEDLEAFAADDSEPELLSPKTAASEIQGVRDTCSQ